MRTWLLLLGLYFTILLGGFEEASYGQTSEPQSFLPGYFSPFYLTNIHDLVQGVPFTAISTEAQKVKSQSQGTGGSRVDGQSLQRSIAIHGGQLLPAQSWYLGGVIRYTSTANEVNLGNAESAVAADGVVDSRMLEGGPQLSYWWNRSLALGLNWHLYTLHQKVNFGHDFDFLDSQSQTRFHRLTPSLGWFHETWAFYLNFEPTIAINTSTAVYSDPGVFSVIVMNKLANEAEVRFAFNHNRHHSVGDGYRNIMSYHLGYFWPLGGKDFTGEIHLMYRPNSYIDLRNVDMIGSKLIRGGGDIHYQINDSYALNLGLEYQKWQSPHEYFENWPVRFESHATQVLVGIKGNY